MSERTPTTSSLNGPFRPPFSWTAMFLALTLGLTLGPVLGACGEDEPEAIGTEPTEPTEPTEAEPDPGEPVEPAAVGPRADSERFEIELTAAGPYAPGTEGQFEIALSPRGEWKINMLYPLSVELEAVGVTLSSSTLSKEDAATIDDHTAEFNVPFSAEEAGQHRVTATLDFGVCIAERCMQELQTVAIVLPVEG